MGTNAISLTEGQDVYVITEFNGCFPGKVVKVTPTGKSSVQCYRRDGTKIEDLFRFSADGYREGSNLTSSKWRRDHIDTKMTFEERTLDLVKKVRLSKVISGIDKVFDKVFDEGRKSFSRDTHYVPCDTQQEEAVALCKQLIAELEELKVKAEAISEPIAPMNLEQLLKSMRPKPKVEEDAAPFVSLNATE